MPNALQILQPRSGKPISILATALAKHRILLKTRNGSIDTWIIRVYVKDTDQSSRTEIKSHLGNRSV